MPVLIAKLTRADISDPSKIWKTLSKVGCASQLLRATSLIRPDEHSHRFATKDQCAATNRFSSIAEWQPIDPIPGTAWRFNESR